MLRTPCPSNFLSSREHYKVTKYRLQRVEQELFKVFEVTSLDALENAMLQERSKRYPRFTELMRLYAQCHNQLDAATDVYEVAKDLQRRRVAEMQDFDQSFKVMDE